MARVGGARCAKVRCWRRIREVKGIKKQARLCAALKGIAGTLAFIL